MIPFYPLQRIIAPYKQELEKAAHRVINSGQFLLGDELDAFEESFAEFTHRKEAVGVGSGLDALRLTLEAYEFPPGSEVLVPANTFVATALAVQQAGLMVVPVDVVYETGQLDVELAKEAFTSKTVAVIPVHLFGNMPDMEALIIWAQDVNIAIIEDAAQAHGSSYNKRVAGSLGNVGCFSFYPGKNLGALGDGGAVVTNDETIAQRVRALRNYGSIEKYDHAYAGTNSRLDELQAAFLSIRLKHLARENDQRKKNAARILEALDESPVNAMTLTDRVESNYHLCAVRCGNRQEVRATLEGKGIATMIHYPKIISEQRGLTSLRERPTPIAVKLSSEIFSLPCFPGMHETEISLLCEVLRGL